MMSAEWVSIYEEKTMRCVRCLGMVTIERIFTREGAMVMSRCVYCGDLVDAMVISNRGRSSARRPPRTASTSNRRKVSGGE